MTLIISTIQQHSRVSGIFMTADRLSWNGANIKRRDTRKLHEIVGSRFVAGPHGTNELGGLPVEELMGEFSTLRGKRLQTLSARAAMQSLIAFLEPHVRATFLTESNVRNTNFTFGGYGSCCPGPHLWEFWWERLTDGHILLGQKSFGTNALVLSGDAAAPIKHFLNDDIDQELSHRKLISEPLLYGQKMHEALYRRVPRQGHHGLAVDDSPLQIQILPDGINWIRHTETGDKS